VRPFLLVWRKGQPLSPLGQAFIGYIMSAEGQSELIKAGLVKGSTTP